MSEHLLSYNERQNRKLAMAWYERIDETVHSTRPVGETNYDEECLNSVNFYWQMADVMLQELIFAPPRKNWTRCCLSTKRQNWNWTTWPHLWRLMTRMNNETTLKVNVKLNLEDAEEQIRIMKNEFDKLKRMASELQETLDKVSIALLRETFDKMSLTVDKLDDDDGGDANAE